MKARIVVLLGMLLLLWNCMEQKERRPHAIGKPYEVTVIGEVPGALQEVLQGYIPNIVPKESEFDLLRVAALEGKTLYRRALLVYDAKKALEAAYNVWASPQIVIRTNGKNAKAIRELLRRFERKETARQLAHHSDRGLSDSIAARFGVRMQVPLGMRKLKENKECVWLSDEKEGVRMDIVLLRGGVENGLKKNIKGWTDEMYLQLNDTAAASGQWQMYGDAMGGPFIKKQIDGYGSAIGLIYAPNHKKRNQILLLKAVLNTIKTKNNGT